MILVFAGAGASAAISKSYPTTVGFYEQLDDEIKSSIDSAVNGSLKFQIDKMSKGDSPVDIERVLWTIDRSLNHTDMCGNKNDVVGRGLHNLGFGLENIIPVWRDELINLQDEIYQEVYRLYGKSPTVKQLDIWMYLMRVMGTIGLPVEIFTTNYDLVLENVINKLKKDKQLKIESGFYLDNSNKSILNTEYLGIPTGGENEAVGRFIKLHGSVNWHREGKDIVSSISKFTGNHSDHAIMYPGFKGMPEDDIFKEFYDHLSIICPKVELAIFIGFSFRDSQINNMLGEAIPDGVIKIIINKEKEDRTFHNMFPFNKEDCIHIGEGFSPNSVDKIISIISKSLGLRLITPEGKIIL